MGKEFVGEESGGPLIWEIRSGSEWLESAADVPEPRKLFGECWLEGEMALMFGDTGKGKSVLAVQIAEMLTFGGDGLGPLENEADVEKVLLVDLELSAKQFAMRYSGEDGSGRHDFSPNFSRVSVSVPFRGEGFVAEFCTKIRDYLSESKAKVLIVDHVTAVRCSRSGTAAVVELMSCLRQMRDELGLSVLMLAQSPKREMHRPISINDLGALKHFGSMADSIFAIGQSRIDPELRYLKQIKTRSTALVYGEDNVAVFRLAKMSSNFLGLEFLDTDEEGRHLAKPGTPTAKLISEMQRLADGGWSQREIAEHFNTSKTRVNRLLMAAQAQRKAAPVVSPQPSQKPVYHGLERCIYEQCEGCDECKGRPGRNIAAVSEDQDYEHKNCPDLCEVCGPRVYKADDDEVDDETRDTSDDFFTDLRYWLIDGKKGERPKYTPPDTEDEENDEDPEIEKDPEAAEPEQATVEIRYRGPDESPDIVRDPSDRMAGLKRSTDMDNHEIFVEEELDSGKAKIWYRYDSKNRITRIVYEPGRGARGDGTFDQLPPLDAPTDDKGRLCKNTS